MSKFKLQRTELFFKPAGTDDVKLLGSAKPGDIQVTDTVTIGDHVLSNTHRPGDPESMKQATNALAKFAQENT